MVKKKVFEFSNKNFKLVNLKLNRFNKTKSTQLDFWFSVKLTQNWKFFQKKKTNKFILIAFIQIFKMQLWMILTHNGPFLATISVDRTDTRFSKFRLKSNSQDKYPHRRNLHSSKDKYKKYTKSVKKLNYVM